MPERGLFVSGRAALGPEGAAEGVAEVLHQAVAEGVFPGAVARVEALSGPSTLLEFATGRVSTRPPGAPVEVDTSYDLASLTKLYTATVALRLVASGELDLDMDVGRTIEVTGLYGVTPRALLEHRSGLPAWRPYYEQVRGDGSAEILKAALAEDLERDPSEPAVYSDVGFLVLMVLLERISGRGLEALVQEEVLIPLGLAGTGFRPVGGGPEEAGALLSSGSIAATEECPRRGLLVGEVHDDNAWAMGGVAPHAGLYGTAAEVAAFARGWWDAPEIGFLPRALRDEAWSRPSTGGTHSLGWDTVSSENSTAGQLLSRQSHGHLGFTGTSLWIDPERAVAVILLSNRVHPNREGGSAMGTFRRQFHDAVVHFVDAL
ncbi:MAG TPA: serine hydrolase [Deltaproteobacteria bacterium]|nr:serine hydrolase [Deltaproteobacteria bacterium]HCP45194.1 serine hydrolase [Deltaproteobacteria bacterium]